MLSPFTIKQAIIQFPEIQLATRQAHYLRGYFGNLFKQHSPLLHNHYDDGSLRYQYPLVQYKVVHNIPTLVGINEGATLLLQLFTQIKTLQLPHKTYPVYEKNIITHTPTIAAHNANLHGYQFATPWLALNQHNILTYNQLSLLEQKKQLLQNILFAHIISFCKAIGYQIPVPIQMFTHTQPTTTKFKNQQFLAFNGYFVCNMQLPPYIGLGKAVSRGFGTILPQ